MMARLAMIAIAMAITCTGLSASAEEIGVGFGSPTTTFQATPDRQYVRIRTSRGDAIVVKDRLPDGRKRSIVEYD